MIYNFCHVSCMSQDCVFCFVVFLGYTLLAVIDCITQIAFWYICIGCDDLLLCHIYNVCLRIVSSALLCFVAAIVCILL